MYKNDKIRVIKKSKYIFKYGYLFILMNIMREKL